MDVDEYFNEDEQTGFHFLEKPDITVLCRICANSSEYLLSIFEGEGLENQLDMKIKKHLPIIEICKEDSLPTSVCYQCASTIIAWHDLTEGCIAADQRLRSIAENDLKEDNKIDVEKCEEIECFDVLSDCDDPLEEEVVVTTANLVQSDQINSESGIATQSSTSKKIAKDAQKTKLKDFKAKDAQKIKLKDENTEDNEDQDNTSSNEIDDTSSNEQDVASSNEQDVASSNEQDNASSNEQDNASSNDKMHEDHRYYTLPDKQCKFEQSQEVATDVQTVPTKIRKKCMCICSFCGKPFTDKRNLRKHMLSHKDVRPFACEVCGKAFKRKDHLTQHIKAIHLGLPQHSTTQYKLHATNRLCNICGNVYKSKVGFRDHLRQHSGEKTFQCDTCGKVFCTLSGLRSHRRIKCGIPEKLCSDDENYICDVCNQDFVSYRELYIHKLGHDKSFVCDICGKGFRLNAQLKCHQIMHTEARPFKCNMCESAFKRKSVLTQHKKTHTDQERLFPCPLCPWRSKQKSALHVHLRTHTKERPYECDVCGKTFLYSGDMGRHKLKHNQLKVESL